MADRPPFRVFQRQVIEDVRHVTVTDAGGLYIVAVGAPSRSIKPGDWQTIKLLAPEGLHGTGHPRAIMYEAAPMHHETPVARALALVADMRVLLARLREQIEADPFGSALARLRARTPARPE